MKRISRALALALLLTAPSQAESAQVFTPTAPPASATLLRLEAELRAKEATRDGLLKSAGHDAKLSTAKLFSTKPADTLSVAEKAMVAAEAEADAAAAAVKAEKDKPRGSFLSQAGFEGGTASPQVTIDAALLYFKQGRSRLYVRSTLPTTAAPAPEANAAPLDPVAALKASLDDRIKSALNDPYGGLLYLAAGRMVRLPPTKRDEADSARGLFLDFRGGAKFVQLPEAVEKSNYRVTPFLVASAGLRLDAPLFYDNGGKEAAGRLNASLALGVNHVLDSSISELFVAGADGKAALAPTTVSVNVSVGLAITGAIGLSVNGTAWSSSNLDRRFVLGVTLLK